MKKKTFSKKVSINALLLLVDLVMIFMLNKKTFYPFIIIYLVTRLLTMFIVIFGILFKVLKTSFIIFKRSKILTTLTTVLKSDETVIDITEYLISIKNIFLLNIESVILLELFLKSIDSVKNDMPITNTFGFFMSLMALNFVLVFIHLYINSRCENMINFYQKKENLAT